MKKILLLAVVCTSFLFSCKKKNEASSTLMVRTNVVLSGSQEVPAVTTSATGSMDYDYDPATRMFHYTIRYNNLTGAPAAMHIHGPAARGANAGVLSNITGFMAAATGSVSGMVTTNSTNLLEADLLAGRWYVNIHTAANAGGELRGQIEF